MTTQSGIDYKLNISASRAIEIIAAAIDVETVGNTQLLRDGALVGFGGDKSWLGLVDGHRFRVRRRISGRNSFLPILVGHVDDTSEGCRVLGQFQSDLSIRVFIAGWLVLLGALLISIPLTRGMSLSLAIAALVFTPFLVLVSPIGPNRLDSDELRQLAQFLDSVFAAHKLPENIPPA